MKITESTVKKLMITGVENLDPVAVIVENFGLGAGKITITCYGEAWSHYWSHMGEKTTLEQFFCKASRDYLICKLKTGINAEIDNDDSDALENILKVEIIKLRRADDITHEQARYFWNDATNIEWNDRHNVCPDILGDEWWHRLPKKKNPDYEYLGRIVETVKEAFSKQEAVKC